MSITFSLYQLQRIDSQIFECDKRISIIQHEMEGNPEIKQSLIQMEESQENFNEITTLIEEINQSINQKKIKIEQSESNLYGGKEKNPKMLQDLQTEIGILKKQQIDLDNELFEKMLDAEKAEQELNQKKAAFQNVETKFNTSKSLLISERENLIQKIERLKTERQAAIPQIPSENLKEYERLISIKQGIAVGTVQENSCSICGTTFTPSQCQASRSQNEIFYCPTCHRIIYGG
jgi:predicted  nucleic acid-binding Zn-ribbon protein